MLAPGHHRSVTLAQSGSLILLLVLLFLLDRGAHLLYGGISFSLLAAYHLLTDYRYPPEQIRAAGLMSVHITVYLLLGTLVIWATSGEEESPYWVIYLLPVAVAATNLGLRGMLLTCSVATGLFVSFVPTGVLFGSARQEENLIEIVISCLMYFVVGVLVQTFSAQSRRQLARQQELNESLLENQAILKESLNRLEAAEDNLRRQDRLAALGEMSAGIAHEIRNPLGVISSSAQLLDRKLAEPASGIRQLLDIIQEETTRLNGLITDFLSFGRPAPPALRPIDLQEAVLKAVEHVEGMARERSVGLVAELPEEPQSALADPDMLQQVLLNLLLNALEASREGGAVALRLHRSGEALCLEVHDSGSGIPPENLSKIFNPFFTTKEKGTGLGLANAHRIIEMHGGTLGVSSEVGEGTTFRITLPRQEV